MAQRHLVAIVYGYTNYLNTNSGSIAAWSLMIATVNPPAINGFCGPINAGKYADDGDSL